MPADSYVKVTIQHQPIDTSRVWIVDQQISEAVPYFFLKEATQNINREVASGIGELGVGIVSAVTKVKGVIKVTLDTYTLTVETQRFVSTWEEIELAIGDILHRQLNAPLQIIRVDEKGKKLLPKQQSQADASGVSQTVNGQTPPDYQLLFPPGVDLNQISQVQKDLSPAERILLIRSYLEQQP